MKSILDDVDNAIQSGKPVYLHCLAGIRRTGSVVGCYLARHDIAVGAKALDLIRRLRANDPNAHVPSPESDIQQDLVRSWKVGESGMQRASLLTTTLVSQPFCQVGHLEDRRN